MDAMRASDAQAGQSLDGWMDERKKGRSGGDFISFLPSFLSFFLSFFLPSISSWKEGIPKESFLWPVAGRTFLWPVARPGGFGGLGSLGGLRWPGGIEGRAPGHPSPTAAQLNQPITSSDREGNPFR